MTRTSACAILLFLLGSPTSPAAAVQGIPPEMLQPVRAGGVTVDLKTIPAYLDRLFMPLLPGTVNALVIRDQTIGAVLSAPPGYHLDRHNGGLQIEAPAGDRYGYARVRIGNRVLTLAMINLIPYDAMHGGLLDGYHVGRYHLAALRGLASYDRPKGFIRLTAANRDLQVSDHYRLRDFQCKLDGAQKFLILRTEALLKLEILQHRLAARYGVHFTRFRIMSGYRTPYYNAMIGNETTYSRHLYGDAMDIYIDENGSGRMNDINGDGRVDINDARFLLKVDEEIDRSPRWSWLRGGAGAYHSTPTHGPFVHIDTRGYVARWGA